MVNKRTIAIGLAVLLILIVIILIYMYAMPVNAVAKYGITSTNAVKSGVGLASAAFVKNNDYSLFMQADGNLVLYRNVNGVATTPLKATYTMQAGNYLTFDNNGSLKIMSADGKTVRWTGPVVPGSSGTWYLIITGSGDGLALVNPSGVATNINIGNL